MIRKLAPILLALLVLSLAAACGEPADAGEGGFDSKGQTCRECHRKLNPGLIADLESSPHEKVPVRCEECHGEDHDRIFAVKGAVPPTVCARCHEKAYEEFKRSRHGRHLKLGKPDPSLRRHAFAVGGCTVTTGCHSIQKPYDDGSVGRCGACHPTHAFSNHEARNPRICFGCHSGHDNQEYKAWLRSSHSLKATSGKGHIADCVECHDTHDVTAGITHGLSPVATETPPLYVPTESLEEFTKQRATMTARCRKCHGIRFAREALELADVWRRRGALHVEEAGKIVARLAKAGLLEPAPKDRVPNPIRGGALRLDGTLIYDLDSSMPERIYYDMRFHLYPALWRGAYHTDPERLVWELNDALKGSLDRLREIERTLGKGKDR